MTEHVNPQVARSRAAAIAAGRDILVADGWDAVTHVAVAERSGVGRSTLYRHWPTIDQLLRDVLLIECAMTHPLPSGVTRADLVADLDAFRVQLRDPALERAMATIIDRATADPAFAAIRQDMYRTCSAVLVDIVLAAQARGDVDAGLDTGHAVAELVGPLVFQHFLAPEQSTRRTVEGLVDGFLCAHSHRPFGDAPTGNSTT